MIGGIFKKIFGGKKSNEKESKPDSTGTKMASSLKKKSQELSEFFSSTAQQVQNEFFIIKEKCSDLANTNYKLGLKHLENGNLSEAIFRFRFVKKFWPNHYDSYHQLAYCLVLDNKSAEAKKILEELIVKNPNCDQSSKDLLARLNQVASSSK